MNSADNTKPYVIDLNQVVLMPAKKMESTVIDLKDTVHDLKDCSLRSTIHEGTENTINADNEQDDTPTRLIRDIIYLILQMIYYICESIFRRIIRQRKKSLEGEVALITGAGHGLGRELAFGLSKLGVKVICWDINATTGEETAQKVRDCGGEAESFHCDVSNREQVADTARGTREKIGQPITMLFNNAGILNACKPFKDITKEEVEKIFQVNVYSQFWMLSEFLPDLMAAERGGHLVCICSSAGLTGVPNMTSYCSTKYALNGLMDAFLAEYRHLNPYGRLGMTTVYPYIINTGFAKRCYSRFPSIFSVLKANEVAQEIIDGVQHNQRKIYLPGKLEALVCINHVLPNKVTDAMKKFIGAGVLPH